MGDSRAAPQQPDCERHDCPVSRDPHAEPRRDRGCIEIASIFTKFLVIVLSLLHPNQAQPIKTWTFDVCEVLRVGRASNSDVVLHSSIVSRRHLELWNHETHWELINFGANGTYIDGKPVGQLEILESAIVRLGSAGPLLQIDCQPTPKLPQKYRPGRSEQATAPYLANGSLKAGARIRRRWLSGLTDDPAIIEAITSILLGCGSIVFHVQPL